jgi:transposase
MTMARSIPVPIRQAILRGFKKGNSIGALAGKFQVAERTVRHLVRCFQDQDNVAPAYDRCGRPKASPSRVIKEAMYLRQQHARWGAGLIRVMLREKYGKAEVPGTRTLQRWLRRLREKPAPPGRRPARESRRARRPHEIWQMDAAEQKRLKTGQQISWLRVVDECSGAVLGTAVFPPRELEPSARSANPENAAEIIRALRFAAGVARG